MRLLLLILLSKIFVSNFGYSQSEIKVTAEEVYSRYIEAIGGKEKLNEIVSQQTSSVTYDSDNRVIGKRIEVFDPTTKQWAVLSYNIVNSKAYYGKFLITHGKMYSFIDGNITESPAPDIFPESIFSGLKLTDGSKLITKEIIRDEESYVINYVASPLNTLQMEMFDYYSINTGLLIAKKNRTVSGEGDFGGSELSKNIAKFNYTFFSDYREVNDVLVPFVVKIMLGSFLAKVMFHYKIS